MKSVLKNTNSCTGCALCAASCSTTSIRMLPDVEGFLAPQIDEESCTDCGLCKRICPSNPDHPKDHFHAVPTNVYAAWNKDQEIRAQSSSGGVFTALAEMVLDDGGVVVGSAFDEHFNVRHILIDSKQDLGRLRGSKYVQSEISTDLYKQIRQQLRNHRKVLFSGTPCQVAGMRQFMKNHDQILFVDILCHGVPSPFLWKEYRNSLAPKLTSFNFRNKVHGWNNYSISYSRGSTTKIEIAWDNTYIKVFLRDIALRQACYECPYASTSRVGDITLADFWGIDKFHPEFDDDKGTSLVFANSSKGIDALKQCNTISQHEVDIADALPGNSILSGPSRRAAQRGLFYTTLSQRGYPGVVKAFSLGPPSLSAKILKKIKSRVKNISKRFGVAK